MLFEQFLEIHYIKYNDSLVSFTSIIITIKELQN